MKHGTKRDLVLRAKRLLAEIRQLRDDAAAWNELHPTERPIIADPRGELLRAELAATAVLKSLGAGPERVG